MEKLLTLKERLSDWYEFDRVAYELGVVLGLFPEFRDEPGIGAWNQVKWVFITENPLGEGLKVMIREMVSVGMLEYDGSGEQLRWNQQYRIQNP